MSPGRVALFLPSFGVGGAERNVTRLAGALAGLGRGVDLVVADPAGPVRAEADDAVRIVDLGVPRVARSVLPLARYLVRERPLAFISSHEHANLAALAARRWSGVRVPLVLTVRSTLSMQAREARDWRDRWVIPGLARRLYPGAERLVALSHAAAADAEAWLGLAPGRVQVIANPVVSDRLLERSRESLDHPLLAPGHAPLIVAVGRLAVEKDHAMLVRAFARLTSGGTQAHLVVIGEGPERPALGRLVTNLGLDGAVTFTGYQANPLPWMARAAVVALSSRYEGLPTVLIEALACGARVVSTDCPSGPREVLGGGQWGTLVPVGDVEAMATALGRALAAGRPAQVPMDALAPYTESRVVAEYNELINAVSGRAT